LFPIRDDNPHFLTPFVTYGLIGLNVLAWILVQGIGASDPLARSICDLGLVPGKLLGSVAPGAAVEIGSHLCRIDGQASWITAISHMFLHGGWLHLIGNLWFLWIFGGNVEDSMGHLRFTVFYLLCGLAAAFAQTYSNPGAEIPMVGASGAIGGVMGAYIVLYPRVRVHMLLWFGFYVTRTVVPAIFMLGYWFLLQLLGGAASVGHSGGGTAFWAHIGGFVAGAILVFPLRKRALIDRHPFHGWNSKRQF
jgi:membrane associated rhomboid family serine protease